MVSHPPRPGPSNSATLTSTTTSTSTSTSSSSTSSHHHHPSRNSSEPPQTLKLLLIGSSSVGKSSLLLRFTDEIFLSADESSATIGVDFKFKVIEHKGKRYKLSIWDTAGQERFRTLTSSYYRGAQGVLLVYDVTNRASFESLPSWFGELDTFAHSPQDVVRVIVGNKVDKEYSRSVSTDEGRAFASDNHALFFETSVKTKKGVEEVFEAVVDKIIATTSSQQHSSRQQGYHRSDRLRGTLPGSIDLDAFNSSNDDDPLGSWCNC